MGHTAKTPGSGSQSGQVINSMKLSIVSPSGRPIDTVQVDNTATVHDLKMEIQHSAAHLRAHRQRIKFNDKVLDKDDQQLSNYGLKDGSQVVLKDLGPQIGWQAVFFIEYIGPLLIHQLYRVIHQHQVFSFTQYLGYVCISFHFLKREYETLFVHRFSHATMPLRNLFKNSAHYWLLSGIWIAHTLYSPEYVEPPFERVCAAGLVFFLAELGNLYSHVILRRLRSKDPKARAIPRGFAFDLVSCPNYLFEIIAWTAFSVMTGLVSAWVFTAISTVQMYLWALKKHRAYKKEFPDYPKNRTPLFPFIP